tara:strand:+ start:354 stop:641 length:288 start_codon:yes stop_codon:yes gene_type:complete
VVLEVLEEVEMDVWGQQLVVQEQQARVMLVAPIQHIMVEEVVVQAKQVILMGLCLVVMVCKIFIVLGQMFGMLVGGRLPLVLLEQGECLEVVAVD